jgi:acetoin utilization deacetylase AcuC-like enzyme
VFNDAAVAAKLLQAEGRVGRVAVIDCDVHQGNGTAAIAAGDEALFTFSIHGAKNFPFRKEASDLDIELPDGTGDRDYLEALERGLGESFARAAPQLVIYLAGADPYRDDRLGRLALSKAGLLERDRRVLEECRRRGVPVAIAMAGGYARDIDDTVDIHYATVRLAAGLA